jgi:hypothetical protein
MQPTEASIVTLWVLVMLALAVAGAALALGVHLTREHRVLGAEHGDTLATATHALGMVKTTREVVMRMAAAAVSTPEGSAAAAAVTAKEGAPPIEVVLAPVVQPLSPPVPVVAPEPDAPTAEPAWNSHFADMHRRLDALLTAQEHLLAVQQASALSVVATPVPGGVTAGPAAFISLPSAPAVVATAVPAV